MQIQLHRPFPLLLAVLVAAGCGSDDDGPTGPSTPAPEITTTTLEDGRVGEIYEAGVNASGGGGEYSWKLTAGNLPPGLAITVEDLTDDDLLITGTPESPGDFRFWLELSVPDGRTDTSRFDLRIVPNLGDLPDTLLLAPAVVGQPYGVKAILPGAGDVSYDWQVTDGSLPEGIELAGDGRFSGSPATADTATFTLLATAGAESISRVYVLPVVPADLSRYNITQYSVVPVPGPLRALVEEALSRWEEALVGDLPTSAIPDDFFGPDGCGGFGERVNGVTIEDVMVMVNIDSIDGPGKILGQAGPCAIADSMPIVGVLTLDEADLLDFTSDETVTDIIQHEVAHILGFGTLWPMLDLVENPDSADPRYLGEAGIAAYQAAGGEDATIPVENQGGDGTKGSHWRETVFDSEIMTGFAEADGTDMLLSRMTIASFQDIGYEVNLDAAEAQVLALSMLTADAHVTGRAWGDRGSMLLGVGPIYVLHDDGSRSILPDH